MNFFSHILKIIAFLFGSMIIYVLYLHKIFRNGSKFKLKPHG